MSRANQVNSDVEDVGGTVDTSVDVDRDSSNIGDQVERKLFMAWKTAPGDFARDTGTRRSAPRIKLRQETGWTDEAIEGWALMLEREPARLRALERRAGEWRGEQKVIERTAWRDESGGDDSEGQYDNGLFNRGRGGRGRGRGRGGSVAGPIGEGSTQRARRGKEVRGSHNRREGRAKKMARGMAG
jgi:activating signal cointegrator complex subunit 2